MQENKNTAIQKQPIHPICWFSLFLKSFLLSGLGGFLITAFGLEIGYGGGVQPTSIYFIGLVLIVVAIFIGVDALKELIAESHVRALEVFYGKDRVVKEIYNSENVVPKTVIQKNKASKRKWAISDDED